MAGQDDRVGLAQVADERADLDHLRRAVPSIEEARLNGAEAYRLSVSNKRIKIEAVTEQGFTANSAAFDGVDALKSAVKSAIVKSVSWPTAEITGISDANIALATFSSLKAHKSSILPPPRPNIIVSAFLSLLASLIPSTIESTADSPCTSTGITVIDTDLFLAPAIFIISLTAAPVGEVITAMFLGCFSISRL